MARTNIAVRTAVLAAFAASAACDTELSAPRTLLGCDPDQRCANGYRCAHTELGAVCLDEQQWAARCADGEACNGRDDDCDGETDEALADVVSGTDEGECAVRIERCQNGALAVIDPGVDPVEEACNGRDDDCDGETDEHVPLRITGSPTGECRVTVSECSDGTYTMVIPGVPPSTETCNGRDDDCDGVTDEDFAFLGTACSVGIGACATSGVYRCSDDGSAAECAAAPGNPGAEVCDGLDNNCDGVPDEIFVELGTACSVGIGACLADGMRVCRRDGLGTACDAMPAEPSSETCNGVDDDCNGVIDNGIPSCCVPGTTRACGSDIGECTMGTQTCAPERAWGACSGIAPSDDSCDGRDNDCDGEADEGLAGCCGALGGTIPCSVGRGACVSGVQTCGDDGLWSACSGILPSDDVCNGRDDDCDGGADEDFPDFGDDCSVGVGACAAAGVRVCAGDGLGTTCGVTAGTPSDETCNLVDDDCDGEVDDGLVTYSGTDVGECQQGIERCFDGAWVVVQERRDSVAETCDGRDEDCDGIADDEAPDCCSIGEVRTCGLSVGRCTVGSQTCGQDFRWSACSGRGPQSERCDGLDNDCNGVADDPWRLQLAMACESGIGACARNGTWACNSNPSAQEERVGVVCDATAEMPGVESCDGIDNDCDGSVDEVADVPPVIEGSSIGRCRPRVLACIDGEMSEIQAAVGPSPEVCNGFDDDCSGVADNDIASAPCYEGPIGSDGVGVCREGATACSGGNVRCITQVLPSPETCDNLDNDCDSIIDGSLDDGNPVPLQDSCYTGPDGTLGVFPCAAGTTTCSGGIWGGCIGEVTPDFDSCPDLDGIDNDCDGENDEIALPWSDGFESGDLSAWTRSDGVAPQIVSDPVRTGTLAARLHATYSTLGGADDSSYVVRTFDACMADIRVTAMVYIVGWTDGGECVGLDFGVLWNGVGGRRLVQIRSPSGGAYIDQLDAARFSFTLPQNLTPGTWYAFEFTRRGTTIEFLLDGVSYVVVEGETGEATSIRIGVGIIRTCADGTFIDVVADDVVLESY